MRVGLGGRGFRPHPPHKIAGFTLAAVGGLVLIFAMPLFVWVAGVGGVLAYLGWSMFHHGKKHKR